MHFCLWLPTHEPMRTKYDLPSSQQPHLLPNISVIHSFHHKPPTNYTTRPRHHCKPQSLLLWELPWYQRVSHHCHHYSTLSEGDRGQSMLHFWRPHLQMKQGGYFLLSWLFLSVCCLGAFVFLHVCDVCVCLAGYEIQRKMLSTWRIFTALQRWL